MRSPTPAQLPAKSPLAGKSRSGVSDNPDVSRAQAPNPHAAADRATQGRALLIAVIVLAALNLRPFLTAVGPLARDISASTGLDLRGLAWLTLLPMLLMGLGAWAGPAVQQRFGARTVLLVSLALLACGCALRAWPGAGTVLVLTAALCGLGVAFVQAVLPGVIKARFPAHVGQVMGLYSAALMGGGALGAQLTPVLAQSGTWRSAMAWWAVPAIAAVLLAWRGFPKTPGALVRSSASVRWMLHRPRTWLLMACFGLVNGGYASVVAWLAPFYQARGWTVSSSASLVALMALAQAGAALLLPALAARQRDRRPWIALTLALQAAGFAGLLWWPDAAAQASAVMLGAGLGGCFALTMVVALDHLADPQQAGSLSALMQGGGFLLAALAPWVIAALHENTGDFRSGWMAHLVSVAIASAIAMRFAPQRYAAAMRRPESL